MCVMQIRNNAVGDKSFEQYFLKKLLVHVVILFIALFVLQLFSTLVSICCF